MIYELMNIYGTDLLRYSANDPKEAIKKFIEVFKYSPHIVAELTPNGSSVSKYIKR